MIMAPMGNMFYSIIIFLLLRSLQHGAVRGEYQLKLEGISAKQTFCSESKVLGDRSVKIVHAYGPCSPTRRQPPTIVEMLARDSLRRAHLHGRVRPQSFGAANHSSRGAVRLRQSASTARVPVGDIQTMGGLGYMVPIYVGTPERMMHVILDTASDFCWIQCEPCIHCYPQEEPIFNPATSSSFSYEQCTDPECNHSPVVRSGGDDNGCDRGRCTYRTEYADGSHTSGFLVKDKVALAGAAWLGNFIFGCGNDNGGIFTRTAGLVNLGRTALSLNKQMSHMGNIFSYCLPPTYRDSGHLTLGDGPYPPAIYTPIVPDDRPDHFYIHMSAMSVNNQLLPVPEGLFVGAKTIIDAGSLLMYIPELAYNALRMVIRNSMSQYKRVRSRVPQVDTCYKLGNATTVDSLTVTLHFTSADLRLGFAQTFFNKSKREHIYCLAFSANRLTTEPSIVGGIQQRGLEVIYNLGENKIGFSTTITNCQ